MPCSVVLRGPFQCKCTPFLHSVLLARSILVNIRCPSGYAGNEYSMSVTRNHVGLLLHSLIFLLYDADIVLKMSKLGYQILHKSKLYLKKISSAKKTFVLNSKTKYFGFCSPHDDPIRTYVTTYFMILIAH